jgi:hypothetical protein
MFLTWNGLKQRGALWTFPFKIALHYAIRRLQVNQDGWKLNGTHQLLVYFDDVNMSGGSVRNTKENRSLGSG